MQLSHQGETLYLRIGRYVEGGHPCIRLICNDGCPYATLTVNPNDLVIALGHNEFVIKTWSENKEVAASCAHLFEDTGRRVRCGYALAEIWRLK